MRATLNIVWPLQFRSRLTSITVVTVTDHIGQAARAEGSCIGVLADDAVGTD